jgi:hypothetical protein
MLLTLRATIAVFTLTRYQRQLNCSVGWTEFDVQVCVHVQSHCCLRNRRCMVNIATFSNGGMNVVCMMVLPCKCSLPVSRRRTLWLSPGGRVLPVPSGN